MDQNWSCDFFLKSHALSIGEIPYHSRQYVPIKRARADPVSRRTRRCSSDSVGVKYPFSTDRGFHQN